MTNSIKQSVWMRIFLAFLVFHMALVLPRMSQASVLSDTLATVGKLGPLLNQYIAPLKLEYLSPMAEAISSCDFGTEVAITKCADTILSTPAAKDALGDANVKEIRALLEIYLDVREGDVAELFSDVIKIATGQSPLELACSVIAIVAGGFPVCDALKALYEVAKLAYEVGKAVVTALADLACGVYELFGGSCGNERKVGPAEFVAIQFTQSSPGLPASLQERLKGQAAWDAHKKDVFAKAKGPDYLYSPANLEAAWTFYSQNAVFPEWDKIVRSKLLDTRKQAISSVTSSIDDGFRAELARESASQSASVMSATRQKAVKEKLDACVKTDAIAAAGVKEWIAAGRATAPEIAAQGRLKCTDLVPLLALPRPPVCNGAVGTVVQGDCSTANGMAVCEAIKAAVGTSNMMCYIKSDSTLAKDVGHQKFKQSLDDLKKPCSDNACGAHVVTMYVRCGDGKGPVEGNGEFAPQMNRDEACMISYNLFYKLSSARLAIEQTAAAEKKRVLAISCKNKAACEESANKQESDLNSVYATYRLQVTSMLLKEGVLRAIANKATAEADQKISQLKAVKFEMSASLAGTVVAANTGGAALDADLVKSNVAATAPAGGGTLAKDLRADVSNVNLTGTNTAKTGLGVNIGTATTATTGKAPQTTATGNLPDILKGGTVSSVSALGGGNAAKAGATSALTAPVSSTPKVDEAALRTCKAFLGRKDEMLCNDARSFAACKTAVDIGQMKTCRIVGSSDVYSKR